MRVEPKFIDIKFKLDMYYSIVDKAENTLEKIQDVLELNKADLTKYVKVLKIEDWHEWSFGGGRFKNHHIVAIHYVIAFRIKKIISHCCRQYKIYKVFSNRSNRRILYR